MLLKMISGGAIACAISALAAMLICGAKCLAAPDPAAAAQPAVKDGSHDFDFIYGKWRMPNHRLKQRLAGLSRMGGFRHMR